VRNVLLAIVVGVLVIAALIGAVIGVTALAAK
jgi:hypothetical protein